MHSHSLSLRVFRPFIVAHPDEFSVPRVVHIGPLQELEVSQPTPASAIGNPPSSRPEARRPSADCRPRAGW